MEPCPATEWARFAQSENYVTMRRVNLHLFFHGSIVNVSEFYSVFSSMYTVHATQLSVHVYALYMHICFLCKQ